MTFIIIFECQSTNCCVRPAHNLRCFCSVSPSPNQWWLNAAVANARSVQIFTSSHICIALAITICILSWMLVTNRNQKSTSCRVFYNRLIKYYLFILSFNSIAFRCKCVSCTLLHIPAMMNARKYVYAMRVECAEMIGGKMICQINKGKSIKLHNRHRIKRIWSFEHIALSW